MKTFERPKLMTKIKETQPQHLNSSRFINNMLNKYSNSEDPIPI